ncbi:MAG TPA: hypothetical protein VMV79_00610, partial [Alphaproteobacteria bacterium]|nr:hypothetical protein [Alphaproteobacteria bacterium]
NFLNTMKANPNASAANILPDAAAANPKVFYDSSGQPRSLSQIYQHFAARFDHAPQLPNAMASTMLADAAPVSPSSSSPSLAAAAQSAIAATESAGIAQGGFTPPVMPQGSFNLASLSGKNLQNAAPQSAGATAAGGANNALPSPSSLFATMMMAQMDTGDITRLPLMSGTAGTNHHKAGAAASADAMA